MKNTNTKQNAVEDGDYRIVGEALGLKPGTIKMIRMGYREDYHNVMEALALVKEHRELSLAELKHKLSELKSKNTLTKQVA